MKKIKIWKVPMQLLNLFPFWTGSKLQCSECGKQMMYKGKKKILTRKKGKIKREEIETIIDKFVWRAKIKGIMYNFHKKCMEKFLDKITVQES